MDESHWSQIRDLLERAHDVPAAERAAWLTGACEDPEVREEVERLLAAGQVATDFLAAPTVAAGGPAPRAAAGSEGPAGELVARLSHYGDTESRYELRGEIGRGGMGTVVEVWDRDLRRPLAMKRLRAQANDEAPDGSPPVADDVLLRFLQEAQVAAQLQHPGVVPVHELGLDSRGRVYYTMPRLHGEDLSAVFERVRNGEAEWSRTRALGVLLRVCEAMAFAHSRGVIHRDLKPGNVMVGRFGEAYVIDWGLAKLEGGSELSGADNVFTERLAEMRRRPELVLQTFVVGTPAYMPPEQARGEVDAIDARSDVYAIGAMLYTLLAGAEPRAAELRGVASLEDLQRVVEGPLPPLTEAPPELAAIIEKAMAPRREQRYPDTGELAEDLRAYVEGRVVHAYRTGALVELRKWIGRNPLVAGVGAAALLIALAGLAATTYVETRGRQRVQREQTRTLEFLDLRTADTLLELERELWPATMARVPAMEDYCALAEDLLSRREAYRDRLDVLGDSATGTRDPRFLGTVADLNADEDPVESARLARVVVTLDALPSRLEAVRARIARIEDVQRRTAESPEAIARWAEAAARVRESERYGGLELPVQPGLLPLEPDPATGLWEFAHLLSGEHPTRAPGSGRWEIRPETGVVLVLVPGGDTTIGALPPAEAQGLVVGEPFVDPYVSDNDGVKLEQVRLDAYFLSKYELTQAQWERMAGGNPSQFTVAFRGGPTHPVEQVSQAECRSILARFSLTLPTEAQWEHGCRGGTTSPYSTGLDAASLQGHANIKDVTWGGIPGNDEYYFTEVVEDGFVYTAPVGSFAPNGFGLHDVHGNVWEWCLDPSEMAAAPSPPRDGDGLRQVGTETGNVAIRGGGWYEQAEIARSAHRLEWAVDNTERDVGVRPARSVLPAE